MGKGAAAPNGENVGVRETLKSAIKSIYIEKGAFLIFERDGRKNFKIESDFHRSIVLHIVWYLNSDHDRGL